MEWSSSLNMLDRVITNAEDGKVLDSEKLTLQHLLPVAV
jgi:hypothetical protein